MWTGRGICILLAGGAPRCSQVVVVRLINAGAIGWRRGKLFRESKLVAAGNAEPGFNDIERTVFSSIKGYGKKGMPLDGISKLVATRLSGVESKLAKLGLRPTASEATGRSLSVNFPLVLLMLIGSVKLMVGLSREKPVGFLILFLVVTLFTAVIVAASSGKLTPAGRNLLDRMRAKTDSVPTSGDGTLCAVALLGISGVAYDPSLAGLDDLLRKEISQIGNSASSSGCSSGRPSGCSSGCGGGCGGCGD